MKCTRTSHRTEFSKKLLLIAYAINITVIIVAVVLMFHSESGDLSPLSYLIPSVSAEVAAGTGFYYWKARCENRQKYAMKMVAEVAEKYGIEAAIQMAQAVLTD